MAICGVVEAYLRKEKRSKLTGNDTTETLTQYKLNFTVTNC